MVKQLEVMVQGYSLKIHVYLLPISDTDLVLGVAQLAKLVPHIFYYSKLTSKFYKETICHITWWQVSIVWPCSIMNNTHIVAEVFTLLYQQQEVLHDLWLKLLDKMLPQLVWLLHDYKSIFAPPTTLLPSRSHDHVILLMNEAKPIKVHPYRYPHNQNSK